MQYPVVWTLGLGLNQDTILLRWCLLFTLQVVWAQVCEDEAEGGPGSKREGIITWPSKTVWSSWGDTAETWLAFNNNRRQQDERCGGPESFPSCLELCQVPWGVLEHIYSLPNEGCLASFCRARCAGLFPVGPGRVSFASLSVQLLNNFCTMEIFL